MKKITSLILALFLCLKLSPVYASSPKFFFNSNELGVKQGSDFDVILKIDTSSQNMTGGDAVLSYNPEMIEVLSIENGGFFPLFGKHYELNNQKIYVTGFFTEKNQTKSGIGTFAKLSMKALKNGATSLQFDCVDKKLSDTNIINVSGEDALLCADLSPLKIAISGGNYQIANASSFGKILGTESGSLIVPTATRTPTPTTKASTSSSLMETGVFDRAALMIFFGAGFVVFGGLLLVYSKKTA